MKRKTKEEFIAESIALHGNKYNYDKSNYKNNNTLIIITCPTHGDYETIPKNHYKNGTGCPICGIGATNYKAYFDSQRKTHEQFLKDAYSVHGDTYDYSQCEYKSGRINMPIICKIHGVFWQHAEAHIHSKHGCMQCYRDRSRGATGKSGYSGTYFETYPDNKNRSAIIYVARMQHENDDFLKVGITVKDSVKKRFYTKSKHGTTITALVEQSTTLYDAFLKETHILENLSVHRYFPNRKFGGYTECLRINDEVISFINSYLNCSISIDK